METSKIQTADYLDILFDGRNKAYGGYRLRKTYQRRLLTAGAIALLIVTGLFLTTLIRDKKPVSYRTVTVAPSLITVPPTVLPPLPQETIVKSKMKSARKLTPPEIRKNEEVTEADKPAIIRPDENIVAGPENIKGSDNPEAIDPNLSRKQFGRDAIKTDGMETEHPFFEVEQMPQFPGGETALIRYLSGNINYPLAAKEAHIQGTVYIRFIIDQKGYVTAIELLRDIGGGCGTEALRVVKNMPKWKPGKQNGQAVKVYYTLPISFKLQ